MKTLNTSMHRAPLITSAIFGALLMTSGALATAAESNVVPQTVVAYGDLDLSNAQGAGVLYSRIAAAADAVCNSHAVDSRNLSTQFRVRACVRKAIAEAVTKVGRPELFAIYSAKTGRPVQTMVAIVQAR